MQRGKRHLWGDHLRRADSGDKAVSEGVREFEKIAIVASSGDYAAPCGICRQVLFEFMPEGKVVLWSELEGEKEFALTELLPFGFRGEDIK